MSAKRSDTRRRNALARAPESLTVNASIVLVDNEPKFLAAYEWLLRGLGCTTFCAQRLGEAIPYVASPRVALVVVEPHLIDGDGLDLIRMARRLRPPGSGIVITAFPSEMGARQAEEAGAAGYLAKPFSGQVFVGLAARLLGTWRAACCGLPVDEHPSSGGDPSKRRGAVAPPGEGVVQADPPRRARA